MSDTTLHHPKFRPFSALSMKGLLKPATSRNRTKHLKTQDNNRIHTNASSQYQTLQRARFDTLRSVSKLIPKDEQIPKDKQQLYEQNLHLKKQVNQLKQQISKYKMKTQELTEKNNEFTRQLNQQFQKKIYWSGSKNHMVSGVKARYDQIKEQLEDKKQQCDELKRQLIQSHVSEFRVYAEELQKHNRFLMGRIKKMSEISEKIVRNGEEKMIPEYAYYQLEQKKAEVNLKLQQKDAQLSKSLLVQQQLRQKIQFLEKVIIKKENNQYYAGKTIKKMNQQIQSLMSVIKNKDEDIQKILKEADNKLYVLRIKEQKRFQYEKQMFEQTLSIKDQRISKLEKQVAYLSTLLTYWKPLDQFNKQMGMLSKYQESDHENSVLDQEIKRSDKLFQSIRQQQANLKQDNQQRRESIHYSNIYKEQQEEQSHRMPRVSTQKHSEDAIKKRKVTLAQVQTIGQKLRYKLICQQYSLQDLKALFDYMPCSQESPENIEWQKQYTTMKEVYEILKKTPFGLTEEEAFILSRYLIEDNEHQFVYCDMVNESKRCIVKSIMKTIVGDYKLIGKQAIEIMDQQCEELIDKNAGVLISELSTEAPSGMISFQQFKQIMRKSKIVVNQVLYDYLIIKMLKQSESVEKLKYMVLF